jgi:uncharacterized membrane protein
VRSIGIIAVALWLGAMAFFSMVVAPAAFGVLGRETAGRLVNAVFPRYYLIGVVLGLVALATVLPRAMSGAGAGTWAAALLVALMVAVTLCAWLVVLPAAHAAREALRASPAGTDANAAARFARLHGVSAALNAVVMLAGVAVLVLEAARRP